MTPSSTLTLDGRTFPIVSMLEPIGRNCTPIRIVVADAEDLHWIHGLSRGHELSFQVTQYDCILNGNAYVGGVSKTDHPCEQIVDLVQIGLVSVDVPGMTPMVDIEEMSGDNESMRAAIRQVVESWDRAKEEKYDEFQMQKFCELDDVEPLRKFLDPSHGNTT